MVNQLCAISKVAFVILCHFDIEDARILVKTPPCKIDIELTPPDLLDDPRLHPPSTMAMGAHCACLAIMASNKSKIFEFVHITEA